MPHLRPIENLCPPEGKETAGEIADRFVQVIMSSG
jgi:hypothetical protein